MSSLDDVNVSNTWKRRLEGENSIQLNLTRLFIDDRTNQMTVVTENLHMFNQTLSRQV